MSVAQETQSAIEMLERSGSPPSRRLLRLMQQVFGFVVFAQLSAIIAIVLAGVIARYIFNSSFSWTDELASWILVSLTFTGMAIGHVSDRHIAINLLAHLRLPGAVQRAQAFLVDVIVTLATLMLLGGGVGIFSVVSGLSAGLQWDIHIKYIVIPIASAASLVFMALTRRCGGRSWFEVILPMGVSGAICVIGAFGGFSLQAMSGTLIVSVAFFAGVFLGVPIAFAMLFAAFLSTWGGDQLPIPGIVNDMVEGASGFVILAIPFFLTAGYLMNLGGLSKRLIDFASALVGHFRGGLAQANVFHSVMLGGVCGSSTADAASTTKILVPEMIRRGYSPSFSCAVTAVGSILPACFPPSIALLIYASVASVSVAQIFMAGIVPGLLMCMVMMITVHFIAKRRKYEMAPHRAAVRDMARAGVRAFPAMFVAVVIVGLLRTGVMTATEVGTIAVIWAFVVGKLFYRGFTMGQFYADMVECAIDTALICFLVGASHPVAWIMIAEEIPQQFVASLTSLVHEKWMMLLLVNIGAFVAGCMLEIVPSIFILAPLLAPLLNSMGVDPIHGGIIIMLNLLLSTAAPPLGILAFITSSIARIPATSVFRECMPFIIACFSVVLLVTFIPAMSLTLWRLIGR